MSGTDPVAAPPQLLPNQRGKILALGLVAWLIGIVGLIALGMGMEHLKRIEKGEMDPTGKGLIVFGVASGVLGLVVNVAVLVQQCAK